MKKLLSAFVVAAAILVCFSGCNNEKTYADILTNKKGWVLVKATSSPDYEMANHDLVADLYNGGYLTEWEKDYIIVFEKNGNEIVKPGKTVAPSAEDGYIAETALGTWSFDNEILPISLKMQVPFFMDEDEEICYIVTFTEDEMVLKCIINDDPIIGKGTYEFLLTYQPAK